MDPNFPPKAKGAALVSFDLAKRQSHVFAEQFNYFGTANEFRLGYQIEKYGLRMEEMKMFNSTTYASFVRYQKRSMGHQLIQELKPFELSPDGTLRKLGLWQIVPELKC